VAVPASLPMGATLRLRAVLTSALASVCSDTGVKPVVVIITLYQLMHCRGRDFVMIIPNHVPTPSPALCVQPFPIDALCARLVAREPLAPSSVWTPSTTAFPQAASAPSAPYASSSPTSVPVASPARPPSATPFYPRPPPPPPRRPAPLVPGRSAEAGNSMTS